MHVIAETSFRDSPRGRVVSLERGDDVTEDGCFGVAIVVDRPVEDSRAEVGEGVGCEDCGGG